MKRKGIFILLAFILMAGSAFAQNPEAEFALFKRTISPVMKWGDNGILTVPKATTIGKVNFYTSLQGQQAGVLENIQLYNTSLSLMAGSSEDVELGYTRRQLVWEDLYFSDLSMDTFHLKARVFNFGDYFIPQVAVGMNAVSLVDNQFTNKDDILFNAYATATSQIPIFTPQMLLSVTAMAETIMNEGDLGTLLFSGGVDFNFFKFLYAMAEVQGVNFAKANNEVINLGAKVRLGPISAGVGMFNIARTRDPTGTIIQNIESSGFLFETAQYVATLAVEINLGGKK